MQTFRDFMEQALYDREKGFYSRRVPTQDFYTAPELHPAFAGVLAREIAKRFERLSSQGVEGPYFIVEMGSGRGLLAGQILAELGRSHPAWAKTTRYALVERSRQALMDSVIGLSASHPHVIGHTDLGDALPFNGVLLSNELVDAFPVHLLEKKGESVFEVFVEESGRAVLGELSRPELAGPAVAVAAHLQEGERHAVNLEALRWLRLVSEKLLRGYVLTVDYGKRFGGFPNPPRSYFRHHVDEAVTEDKGTKDITASVDFDALIAEGQRLGLAMDSYTTLSRFLIDGGIGDWLASAPFPERARIKTLIHPEGMGEVFKVLVQRKSELPS